MRTFIVTYRTAELIKTLVLDYYPTQATTGVTDFLFDRIREDANADGAAILMIHEVK